MKCLENIWDKFYKEIFRKIKQDKFEHFTSFAVELN
jgi:hypothetical protein